MTRATIIVIAVLTFFFTIMTCSLFIASLTMGKHLFLIPAFICLVLVNAGVHLLVYKV